jgi:2',3'-cyclic-nucleotide 2'-phosphodiesterase (5'-nucleotidase family)
MHKKLFSLFFLCAALHGSMAAAAEDITILFTHDLHSMFLPHRVKNNDGQIVLQGGYARLYTAIQQARAQHRDHTLLVDAGDFASGSFFFTLFPTHCAELQLMAAMGYDVTTLGNHDFDFNATGLADALNAAKQTGLPLPAITAANLKPDNAALATLQAAFNRYPVTEYVVLERGGKRIGVFGLLGNEAMHDAPAAALVGFENRFNAARRLVKKLREEEHADIVVCLSHSGTNPNKKQSEDEQLAEKVAGIDVIISGHSHTVLEEPITVHRTLIASAGCYARYLGALTMDAETHQLRHYRLIPINNTLADDERIAARIAVFRETLHMDDTVGFSAFDLPAAADSNHQSLLGNFIADAFRTVPGAGYWAPGAAAVHPVPVSVVPYGTVRNDLPAGWITEEQLFGILPLGVGADRKAGYPLVGVYLSGKELWDLCEVDASCAPLFPDAQLFFSGLRYTCNPRRLFCNRVTQVLIEDENGQFAAPHSHTLYLVVGSLYAAQMLGLVRELTHGILSIEPKDEHGQPLKEFFSSVIKTPEGAEWKEWQALSRFISTFAQGNIPACYAAPQQRKIIHQNASPYALLKQPNGFAGAVYGTATGIFAGVVFLIIRILRKLKKQYG